MLIRTFLFFVAVLLIGLGVDALFENPGVLELQWYGWKLSTSVAFAVVAFALVGLIVVMMTSLYIWLVNAPKRLRKHWAYQRQEKGFLAFNDALQALALGEDDEALKKAKYAHKQLPHMPLADTLLAEITSRRQAKGEAQIAVRDFQKLLEKPHTKVIGLRGLLAQALQNGNGKQALTYALDFYQLKPKSPYVLNILTHLFARQQQVPDALEYADKLVQVLHKDTKEYERALFIRACLQRLQVQQLALSGQPAEAIKLAEKAVKQFPDFIPLVLQLAHLHDQQGDADKSKKLLRKTYKEIPNLKIGRAWLAHYQQEKEEKVLKRLEKFTSAWPEALTSDLLKAQAYIGMRKYSEARKLLEQAQHKGDDRTVFELMGEVESQQQPNSPHAAKWLQRALNAPDRLQAYDGHVQAFDLWRRALIESPLIHLQNIQMPTSLATALVTYEEEVKPSHEV